MGLKVNDIESIYLELTYDLSHVSYLVVSIQELCIKYEIEFGYFIKLIQDKGRVNVTDSEIKITQHILKKIAFIKVKLKTGKSISLTFDFDDSNAYFSLQGLNKTDFYFKRTYIDKDVQKINQDFPSKIFPLGIPFMLKPDKLKHSEKFKFSFYLNRLSNAVKFDRNLFIRLQNEIKKTKDDWYSFISTRTLSDFESFSTPKNLNIIFYQKRFFPNENSEDTRAVHQQRVDIVRLLKKEFPLNFKGGIKDDQNLLLKYKDCASSIKGSQQEFLKIVKESGICIYTRGLSNSIGWTLPEFMSQGKAIIAERQSVIFPEPIEHNIHLLYFENIEELKSQIHYLLNNPEEVKRISKNARLYYEENISPKIYFKTILKQINA